MPYNFLNLQLFSDEGMAGAEGSTGEIATSTAENPAPEGVATQSEGEPTATADGSSWDELINGKYKKDYEDAVGNAVDNAIKRRFKNQRDLQGQIDKIDPIVKTLAQRYGVNPNPDGSINIEALNKAVMDDNAIYEEEAFKRGMSVEDLKQLKQLEYENQQLKAQQTRTSEQREWDDIMSQSNQLKQMYPQFNIDEEMSNPEFGRMLVTMQRSGFPEAVRIAYEAVHHDEIMGAAMRHAVEQTNRKISNSIQSGQSRPVENGMSAQSAASAGAVDPSKLTKAQIDEYRKRAERGERITFR